MASNRHAHPPQRPNRVDSSQNFEDIREMMPDLEGSPHRDQAEDTLPDTASIPSDLFVSGPNSPAAGPVEEDTSRDDAGSPQDHYAQREVASDLFVSGPNSPAAGPVEENPSRDNPDSLRDELPENLRLDQPGDFEDDEPEDALLEDYENSPLEEGLEDDLPTDSDDLRDDQPDDAPAVDLDNSTEVGPIYIEMPPAVQLDLSDDTIACVCPPGSKRLPKDLHFTGMKDGRPTWCHLLCKPYTQQLSIGESSKIVDSLMWQVATAGEAQLDVDEAGSQVAAMLTNLMKNPTPEQLRMIKHFTSHFLCDGPCEGSQDLRKYSNCKKCHSWQHKPCMLYGQEGDVNGPVCNRCYVLFISQRDEIVEWQRNRLLLAVREAWLWHKVPENRKKTARYVWVVRFLARYLHHNQGLAIKFICSRRTDGVESEAAGEAGDGIENIKAAPEQQQDANTGKRPKRKAASKSNLLDDDDFGEPGPESPAEEQNRAEASKSRKQPKRKAASQSKIKAATESGMTEEDYLNIGIEPLVTVAAFPKAPVSDDDEVVVSMVKKPPRKKIKKEREAKTDDANTGTSLLSPAEAQAKAFKDKLEASAKLFKDRLEASAAQLARPAARKSVKREHTPPDRFTGKRAPRKSAPSDRNMFKNGYPSSDSSKSDQDDKADEDKSMPPPAGPPRKRTKKNSNEDPNLKGIDGRTSCACPNIVPTAKHCFLCEACVNRQHRACSKDIANGPSELKLCNVCYVIQYHEDEEKEEKMPPPGPRGMTNSVGKSTAAASGASSLRSNAAAPVTSFLGPTATAPVTSFLGPTAAARTTSSLRPNAAAPATSSFRTPASALASLTAPSPNYDMVAVRDEMLSLCSTVLWRTYCNIPGPRATDRDTTFDAPPAFVAPPAMPPADWLTEAQKCLLAFVNAVGPATVTKYMRAPLGVFPRNQQQIMQSLRDLVIDECRGAGAYKGKRNKLGILLEVLGMEIKGTVFPISDRVT